MTITHRGWTIREDATAPITGRWKATKFGVRVGGNTLDLLKNMIDAREMERSRAVMNQVRS